MKGKYIIVKTEYSEMPILFPMTVNHDSIVAKSRVISAGFFDDDKKHFDCYGRSESLNIEGRGQQDAELMNVFFNLK